MQIKGFDLLFLGLLILLLGTAVYTDIRFGKVYNRLTIPAMVAGVGLNTAVHHLHGLQDSAAGLGFVLLLYLVFASGMRLGGGDIKLMMAAGALLGFWPTVWAVLYSAALGGVLALAVLALRRKVLAAMWSVLSGILLRVGFRAPVEISTVSQGIPFRYSPAIAMGTILAYFLRA